MSDIKTIFDNCVEQGMDKNATIMALAQEGGLDITKAVREYNSLARDAGLIMSTKERNEKINEFLSEVDPEDIQEAESRKELVNQIADDYDLSTASAAQHIKKFAEANEIELPTVQRTSLEDMVQFVKEQLDAGLERADVVAALQEEMGYTANSAASAYSRATRELGLSSGGSGAKAPIDEVVKFIRDNLELPRKQAVIKMCEEFGYAESTANSFYIYLNFAQEYSRQEMEEAA